MRLDLVRNEKGKLRIPELKGIEKNCNDDFKKYYKYYKNNPTDLMQIWEQRAKMGVNPNNFAPSGYPKYIVDLMSGYIGSPDKINYNSDDKNYLDLIDKINKANHENTLSSKEVKEAGIYGVSCELHFIQKKGNKVIPRFIDVNPAQVVPIYDTTIAKDLVAVCWVTEKHMLVYYTDEIETYIQKDDGEWELNKTEENDYEEIPWVITQNNDEKEPTWFCVKSYIDIINSLQTNTLNALDKHARGTLITSLQQSPELVQNLQHYNAIFDMDKGDDREGKDFFDFVDQNLDPDLRETMLTYFVNELHKISGIFDFTKLDLGQDPSGTALKYRIYPMELKASEIVSYRIEGLEKRYELINKIIDKMAVLGNAKVSSSAIDIEMVRNIPDNVKAILEENNLMASYVDAQTLRERVPNLDANEVEKRMTKEDSLKIDLDNVKNDE